MNSEITEFVGRGMQRSAAIVHRQMGQGLTGLATVVSIAPLVGVFGTLLGIANAFRGTTGPKISIMAGMAKESSEALVPTALGLIVALVSMCCYQYLKGRLARFDSEMQNATLELLNLLAVCPVVQQE